jgi:hypothetical protein
VKRDHQRVFAQDHRDGLAHVARPLLLERSGRLRDLLCDRCLGLIRHDTTNAFHWHEKKPTWPNARRHSTTSVYSSTDLPARAGLSLI